MNIFSKKILVKIILHSIIALLLFVLIIKSLVYINILWKKNKVENMVVAVSADYPPFEYKKDNEIVGYDIDLISIIADKLNVNLKIIDVRFKSIIEYIIHGEIDMAISALSYTDDRVRLISFSDIYYVNSLAAVHLKENTYTKMNDFIDKKIGVYVDTTMELFLKTYIKNNDVNIDLITLDTDVQALEALKLKRIEVIFLEKTQAQNFIYKYDDLKMLEFNDDDSIYFNNKYFGGYVMIFNRNSKFKDRVNTVLKELNNNGKLREIEKKWLY